MVGEANEGGQDREAEAAAPMTPGRAPTRTPRARGSQCGVSIDAEGVTPDEGLANASAATITSHVPDKRYTSLSAGGIHYSWTACFSLRGRTHAW